ncbi:hypothetical protein DPMN_075855, partial [Dreissena polymorpha]
MQLHVSYRISFHSICRVLGLQGTPEGQQPAGKDVFQVLLAAQKSYTHLPKDMLQTRTKNV